MTIKTMIELEFEIEFDYIPEERQTRDCPGSSEDVEVTNVECCDPRFSGKLTLEQALPQRDLEVQRKVNKLVEELQEECLKDVHESAEDPRI